MGRALSGTSQGLTGTPPVSTLNYPFSFAAWVYVANITTLQAFIALDQNNTSGHMAVLYMDASGKLNIQTGGSNLTNSTSAASLATNTWTHVAGVWTSSTLRVSYLNAVASPSDTTSNVLGGPVNFLTVGCYYNGSATLQGFLNGRIAFSSLWSVALSATDITALKNLGSALMVRPGALLDYYRLTGGRSPEPDLLSTRTLALTGAPTEVANPLIFRP